MGYSRKERETSIIWDEATKQANVYTASRWTMRRLDALCRDCPEDYRRTWTETGANGEITAARYQCSANLIAFRRRRVCSEEQRKANTESIAKARERRWIKYSVNAEISGETESGEE